MPRYVSVPTSATAHLIRQAYEAGGAYQWGREAWRNSDESGATKIHFDIERQAAENLGVLRRVIIDNGAGMAPDDMRDFLTSFGGGGKPIGVDSNFGQGFKSAVLPWNPYGVVVISYTEAHPNGSMLWIERDKEGNYRLHEWEIEDEFGEGGIWENVVEPGLDEEHGCDWSKLRPSWLKTGTIMVLLGDSNACDTVDGDPDPTRAETTQGLVRYLNGRLLDVPLRGGVPVETTIVDYENRGDREGRRESKDKTIALPNGRVIALHQRKVEGLRAFIPKEALAGTVAVDEQGTEVEWFLVPEGVKAVSGAQEKIAQKPVIVVDYQGEAYHADTSVHRYRQFGITDEIRMQTWLIVRPPVYSDRSPTKWGVLTQASRNMLIAKGGAELPWETWGDNFYKNFPKELAQARDKARENSTVGTDPNMAKDLTRILDRLNPRFKASRLLTSAMGKVAGFPTGAKGGAAKRTPKPVRTKSTTPGCGTSGSDNSPQGEQDVLTPGAEGPQKGEEKNVRGGYPKAFWKSFGPETQKYLADYNPKEDGVDDGVPWVGAVNLNVKHPVFVQEFHYWANEVWPKADPKVVQELVMSAYGREAVAHVVHAQRLNGTVVGRDADGNVVRLGPQDVEEMVKPAALSAALLGLVNVEQRLLTQGGGLFGSRANAS